MNIPAIGLGIDFLRGTPRFSMESLWAAGEQGWWFDASDLSTMFQDTAGTVPVTAVGQSVALHRDKSGRGNHRAQAVVARRPVLSRDANGNLYLAYDGTRGMSTVAPVPMSASSAASAFVGIRKESNASLMQIVEFSTAVQTSNPGSLFVAVNPSAYFFAISNTANATLNVGGFAAPRSDVVSVMFNYAAPTATQIVPRVNGISVSGSRSGSASSGPLGTYPAYFGARADAIQRFIGYEYQSICVARLSSEDETAAVERYIGSKMGITL